MVKTRIGVLVSGGGTNLQALMDACACGLIKSGEIAIVISSNKTAYALERAANAGIRAEAVDRKEAGCQQEFEDRIEALLRGRNRHDRHGWIYEHIDRKLYR